MGCNCSCHKKLEKIKVRGCCFSCEASHDPLRNALQEALRAKSLVAGAGAGVGNVLMGAQDAIQEDRDKVSFLALENGKIRVENRRLRLELGRAAEILSGRERPNLALVVHDWEKMLGRFG